MAAQSALLDQMKERAEALWRDLIAAKSEKEKTALREQYRSALETYRRQCLIAEGQASIPGPSQVPRAKPDEYPDPFEFHDYREFLLAWLKSAKSSPKSFKAFADQSGVNTEELARALKRWEPLRAQTFRKIVKVLKLPDVEAEYLEALHCISDTPSKAVRDAAIKRLQGFPEFRKAHPPEYEAWRYPGGPARLQSADSRPRASSLDHRPGTFQLLTCARPPRSEL
jgi:hypothetical protein